MSKVNSAPDSTLRVARVSLVFCRYTAVLTGVLVLVLSSHHPAAEATVEAELPSSLRPVELFDVPVLRALGGTARSLSLFPRADLDVPGRAGRITIMLPIPAAECPRLRRSLGGSCGDHPGPPLRPLSDPVAIEAPDRLPVRIAGGRAATVHLGHNASPTDSGAPSQWSVAENAANVRVEVECKGPQRLTLSLPSGETTAACAPISPRYRVPIAIGSETQPAIVLDHAREFHARLRGKRAKIKLEEGDATAGGDETEVSPDWRPRVADLEAADPEGIHLVIRSPWHEAVGSTTVRGAEVERAQLEGDELLPSIVEQYKTPFEAWIIFLVTSAFGAFVAVLSIKNN